MPAFLSEYATIRRQAALSREAFPFGKIYPCLQEKDQQSGVLTEHYFSQDLYVARKIFENKLEKHGQHAEKKREILFFSTYRGATD